MKTLHTPPRRADGFSLIEIMVAVVVICVGLLGIAKMQAMALSNTNMSRQRSLAAIEAASFASAMHSNRQYWSAFAVNFSASITGTPAVVTVTGDPTGALAAQITAALGNLNLCMGGGNVNPACNTAVNLAGFDLARWWANSVSVQLPNPTATVSCPASPVGNPAPVSCTVQISWTEHAVAMNASEAAQVNTEQTSGTPSDSEKPVFTLYVEP